MHKIDLFPTQIWLEQKPEFVDYLNRASDPFIRKAEENNLLLAQQTNYFGYSNHSTKLMREPVFSEFRQYVTDQVARYINEQGADMSKYNLAITDMWVQDFAKRGGGFHSAHVHCNDHVSAFFFLKCSDKTSYPIFHDPRIAARMVQLPAKDPNTISGCSEYIHYKCVPGTLLIFPAYLMHEFPPDHGIEPFRFIHFNFRGVLK